jgi:hypothetical protein
VLRGTGTRPVDVSGSGTGGSPCSSVVTQEYCSALWFSETSSGNVPRSGRDHGSGLNVLPYAARMAVPSNSR